MNCILGSGGRTSMHDAFQGYRGSSEETLNTPGVPMGMTVAWPVYMFNRFSGVIDGEVVGLLRDGLQIVMRKNG